MISFSDISNPRSDLTYSVSTSIVLSLTSGVLILELLTLISTDCTFPPASLRVVNSTDNALDTASKSVPVTSINKLVVFESNLVKSPLIIGGNDKTCLLASLMIGYRLFPKSIFAY